MTSSSSSSSSSLLLLFSVLLFSPLGYCHSPSCGFTPAAAGSGHHHGGGGDHVHHHHHHDHDHDHGDDHREVRLRKLPEELAEEEDLALEGFHDDHHHRHHHHNHHHDELDAELSPLGLWVKAMGCSLLVSLASLICLLILPVICLKGKPSKAVVDSLAVFGAGAMLGDAFLHQLPHAFGGGHSHSHEHHIDDTDHHHDGHGHGHAHSLQDLSIGISVLSGIVLFLFVEKVVRYVEEHSKGGAHSPGHGHTHSHKRQNKLKEDDHHDPNVVLTDSKSEDTLDTATDSSCRNDDNKHESLLRKRATRGGSNADDEKASGSLNGHVDGPVIKKASSSETLSSCSSSSLIFGYLNLFSDGVHNFTDGMALGSAFLLHGSVGGWSRTLFLLAHELPQEIGDFGILVRSGFSVSKALFFNFLSALVALAGTALALVLGKDPGQSSLIEGFTAGGFIYIAVAGVLPEMNNEKTTVRSTAVQITSLILGMAVALSISLVE